MKLHPAKSGCSQWKGCRGFWGKPRAGRKPGAASTFPQTTDSQGTRHLLKQHYTLLFSHSSLAICVWPPPGPEEGKTGCWSHCFSQFYVPSNHNRNGPKISHPLLERGTWVLRVTRTSSTHRITDWLRLESCTAISHVRSGKAEPITTKQVLITAQYKYKHLGKRRILSGRLCTSSSTTARTRSQSSCRRDAKGQEVQEEKEPGCEAGQRLRLRNAAVPGTAGSQPLPALHRAPNTLLGQSQPQGEPRRTQLPPQKWLQLSLSPASPPASRMEESWARSAGTAVQQASGGLPTCG